MEAPMKLTTWWGSIAMQVLLFGIALATIAKAKPSQDHLANQHFFCNTGYTLNACHEQIATLKAVVDKFSSEALGEWTWVLVRSQDWKQIAKTLGLNPDSPAFTCLETKTTFIEEALVAQVPERGRQLIARWHMGMTELLNTAIEHEMGHAICHSLDENKAKYVAEILEHKRPLSCQAEL
jgi:hypothetical protein